MKTGEKLSASGRRQGTYNKKTEAGISRKDACEK